MTYRTSVGRRYPGGAHADAEGVNFAVYGRDATAVELLLYERADSTAPFQVVPLDPEINRTYFTWHVYVHDLRPGAHYTWRLNGPDDTAVSGHRFNANKELVDPWARAVTTAVWSRARARDPSERSHHSIRGVVAPCEPYDWEGDRPLNHALEDSVIYELHVGGFTRHPSSGVRHPGTFAGLLEKIPYLQALGVTDVELLPVMAFDEQDVPPAAAARGLRNFWGYSTHSFWSPHPGYCISPQHGTHVREFRDMVKAMHRAGIGVILDVVVNHTAEGGSDGPTINFKGLGNATFYHLDATDRSRYRDYTGCGNTVNCNHPIVVSFLCGCLEYWVRELHVDGFRFDLASVLARGEDGTALAAPPMVWALELSEPLTNTRLIAEAWDAGGLYQVGAFPGVRWAEWNGRYRDLMRRFARGDPGLVGEVATRIAGSSDLYEPNGELPVNSVNFVTCHDGFTLWDLVSYNEKHNEANGDENRDGSNDNVSWNGGIEGDTDDPAILALRRRRAKNFLAVLLLSQGVPMLLAGDEVLRTQHGNNNAYCQDNETSWFDWRLVEKHAGMLRFVRALIGLRRRHRSLRRRRFLTGRPARGASVPDIAWHGERLGEPPWHDGNARVLAFTLAGASDEEAPLHVMLNMSDAPVAMGLPDPAYGRWALVLDTALDPPNDAAPAGAPLGIVRDRYELQARSVAVLEGFGGEAGGPLTGGERAAVLVPPSALAQFGLHAPPPRRKTVQSQGACHYRRPGNPLFYNGTGSVTSAHERRARDGGGVAAVPLGLREGVVDLLERIRVRDQLLEGPARLVAHQEVERLGDHPRVVHDHADDLLGAPHELRRLQLDLG
ncbi:MAG: glycogen debranching enzyme GlgX, partial [Betaproteobacteria bacterium]